MSGVIHFHTADVDRLLSIVGSADRDVLREIGVRPGEEFRAPFDEEEETYEGEEEEEDEEELEEDEVEEEWDFEAEESASAKEVLTKMVMAGVPPDLADNEAAAIQDFMASHALEKGIAHPVDTDEVIEAADAEDEPRLADAIRKGLLDGVDQEEMSALIERLQESGASAELVTRLQMLCFGRLPEAEEPSFIEPDEIYSARSGYLHQQEIVQVSDELNEIAERAAGKTGLLVRVLAALFHYCNVNSRDLFVTIEE